MPTELEVQSEQLLTAVVEMGERADAMLDDALRAVASGDPVVAQAVIDADQAVDRGYERVQHGVLAVVALHGPVGHDLRLLTALIHVSLHAERMGDYAVNVARTAEQVARMAADDDLTEQLVEMGQLAREVSRTALRSFVEGDVELARSVGSLDDGVDRLNVGIFRRLVRLAAEDETQLEWATWMIGVARQLERYADHGVDIAEQTLFVATGEVIGLSSQG